MSEYIPKDKVLELWWYWKFIEAYDQTKEMKGIELDDYVPREWHDRVCEEMAKHHTADRPKGKWTIRFVKVDNGMGGTYRERRWYCSACSGWQTYGETDYCPWCGADMRPKGDDDA